MAQPPSYGTAPPPPYQEGPGKGAGYPQGGYQPPPAGAYPQAPAGAYHQPPAGAYHQPPAGAYHQPPAGAYQPQGYQQGYNVVVQPQATVIGVIGGCPTCKVGVLEDDFTCLGVCCAILFFPIGILCCLAMKQRRCPNCGALFS